MKIAKLDTMNFYPRTFQLRFRPKPMKTSDKILIFLVFAFLGATLANNFLLKVQYEKVKISDHKSIAVNNDADAL